MVRVAWIDQARGVRCNRWMRGACFFLLSVALATTPGIAWSETPPRRAFVLTGDLGVMTYGGSPYHETLRLFGHAGLDVGGQAGLRGLWAPSPYVLVGGRLAYEYASAGRGGDLVDELVVHVFHVGAAGRLRLPLTRDRWHGPSAELDAEFGLAAGSANKSGVADPITGPRAAVHLGIAWRSTAGIQLAVRVGHQWVWWDRGFGDGLSAEINGWIAGFEVGVSP